MNVKQYFLQLTGLRAIAAYMVFLTHVIPNKDFAKNNFTENICSIGYLGVSVFFVLSGFLISYRYMDDFKFSLSWFKTYMVNRIARIYPMYFILTVATFFYNDYFHVFKMDPIIFFTNLTFLRGYFDDFLFTGISQGWSLTVEETFYLIAPLLFLILFKKNRLIILSVSFILLGVLLVFVGKQFDFYHFMGNYKFMFYFTFFGRCIEFFIGIKLALFLKKQEDHHLQSGNNYKNTIFGLLTMIFVIVLLAILKGYFQESYLLSGIILLLNNLVFPLAVYFFMKGLLTESSYIKDFLSTKIMVVLGKSSYVFYLIHIGFISYFISDHFGLNTFALFIVLNTISILFYYFLESPLNNLIRKLAVKKSAIN